MNKSRSTCGPRLIHNGPRLIHKFGGPRLIHKFSTYTEKSVALDLFINFLRTLKNQRPRHLEASSH